MSDTSSHREFATIDLGSNSFHLIVARIINGSIQILSRVKRRVRLAEGLNENRQLSAEAIERGVACLALFAKRLSGFSDQNVKVIGTYTLRRAVNNAEFLAKAANVFPFPIQIISGEEEARLIYTGVSHTQPERERKLVVDIGGGSTEMCIGDGFIPLRAESRHMGCVSFAKRFFPNGELTERHFQQAYHTAMEKISDLSIEYQQLGWKHVLGSSGTIKTVAKVLIENGYRDGIITEERLQILVKRCLAFPSLQHIQLKGLLEERADILVPGLAILLALFHTFHITSMRYSDGALREGVMYSLEESFQVDNIRQRTVCALIKQFHIDEKQATRVQNTALMLFEQVEKWQNPNDVTEIRSLLKWASQLHEIGISINHNSLHRHSAYIITHSQLPGFDSEQQNLIALLTRYHLKGFKLSDLKNTSRFNHRDTTTLLCLFRLAILLNRARQTTAELIPLTLKIKQTHWQLQFTPQFLENNPLILADLQEEAQYLDGIGLKLEYQ